MATGDGPCNKCHSVRVSSGADSLEEIAEGESCAGVVEPVCERIHKQSASAWRTSRCSPHFPVGLGVCMPTVELNLRLLVKDIEGKRW